MGSTAQADPETLVRARKLAQQAQRKARKVASDQELNRSTRARNALKIRAQALDEVERVLAGKA